MKKFKTTAELKAFSKRNQDIILDMYIDGIKDHKGKKGIVFIDLNDSGEIIGFGYNVIDRRKLKFINLSLNRKQSKNLIGIYWAITKNGESINAAKQIFEQPLIGKYSMIE